MLLHRQNARSHWIEQESSSDRDFRETGPGTLAEIDDEDLMILKYQASWAWSNVPHEIESRVTIGVDNECQGSEI
jgi:hypothetical protein